MAPQNQFCISYHYFLHVYYLLDSFCPLLIQLTCPSNCLLHVVEKIIYLLVEFFDAKPYMLLNSCLTFSSDFLWCMKHQKVVPNVSLLIPFHLQFFLVAHTRVIPFARYIPNLISSTLDFCSGLHPIFFLASVHLF